MKKAILFGSSGFIGSHLLTELLNDADYEQITIVVRKNLGINHPKLKTLIGDYASLPTLKESLIADELFITLGTTQKNAPNKNEYYQIDHDYPVLASSIALAQGTKSVFIVTAVGADANSNFGYVKTKGEVERDIIALGFEHTHIFRPSMIMGNRKESRSFEKVIIGFFKLINPLLRGSINKYRGIDGKDIARAMRSAAKHQTKKVAIYQWQEMKSLL